MSTDPKASAPDVQIIRATDADLAIARNLIPLYLHDMSEFLGWPCRPDGLYAGCMHLQDDWRDGKNVPFMIRVDGELGGFATVKAEQVEGVAGHFIQEFFILRFVRRRGVGRIVATKLFDAFPGNWKVQQLAPNDTAVNFWRAIINDYTHGRFTESSGERTEWGEMNTMRFNNG